MKPRALTLVRFALGLMVAWLVAGCVSVRPWQRHYLAKRSMRAGLGEDGLQGLYRARLVETTTAGGLPGEAPGGGCGCTQ